MRQMNLVVAMKLINTAQEAAAKTGARISIAVVDASGCVVALSRMDGALAASAELARVKAETAQLFSMPTKDLSQAGALATALSRPVALFGGGIPLQADGQVVGAIGVAGGMPDQDHELAAVAAAMF